MTEFKRRLKCLLRLAICDELSDIRSECLYGREHGEVSNAMCERLYERGCDEALLDRSGSVQWQYGRDDHRADASL